MGSTIFWAVLTEFDPVSTKSGHEQNLEQPSIASDAVPDTSAAKGKARIHHTTSSAHEAFQAVMAMPLCATHDQIRAASSKSGPASVRIGMVRTCWAASTKLGLTVPKFRAVSTNVRLFSTLRSKRMRRG